ncbi:cytochrome P450 4d1-like isoform X2 [Culicoides brevitarsis]
MMDFPRIYGANLALWGIGNKVDLLVTNPKDIEVIMNGKTTKKSNLYDFIEPWLGTGLLISYGKKWHNRRKIITPSFHFKILEKFIEVFNEQDKILVQKLNEHVGKDEFNIYSNINAIALDNVCEAAMGVKIRAQDNPDQPYIKAVQEMSEIIFDRIFSILHQFPTLYALTPKARRGRQLIKILHGFTNKVITDRRQQLKENGILLNNNSEDIDEIYGKKAKLSFLDMLLNATIDGKPLTNDDIREEVDTFMFEGHDTTTSAMTFIVYRLALNPDVQERAFNELQSLLGTDPDTPCSYNDLQEMKYLEMVIKEALRMHPSVPLIGRQTLEPMQIEGNYVPAGVDINIPIYALHHNADVFPDPEKFDPERFTEEGQKMRNPYDYIPFSAGNRNCIGQRFAMLEMKAVISTILRHYKIIATEKTRNVVTRADIVLRPVGGMYVRLEKRT